MSVETFLALLWFALISAITPGPNNVMLTASGLNFGIWRTLPHAFGIMIGFSIMVVLVALGFGAVFEVFPQIDIVLKICATAFMLYLAYKIATARPPELQDDTARPMRFIEAAGFQWINPKAWAMASSSSALFLPADGRWYHALLLGLAFAIASVPSTMTWTILGDQMRRLLGNHQLFRVFNIVMALLLVATLYFILE